MSYKTSSGHGRQSDQYTAGCTSSKTHEIAAALITAREASAPEDESRAGAGDKTHIGALEPLTRVCVFLRFRGDDGSALVEIRAQSQSYMKVDDGAYMCA